MCIEINDTCLIFEFKRTTEDCAGQLKCQAEKLKENCEEAKIHYVDFNWKKIVHVLLNVLSLQKQINTENSFSSDFLSFLENSHPEWFPHKTINSIPYPQETDYRNSYYLNSRLNEIKSEIANKLGAETNEIKGKYRRLAISVSWGWANEIHINTQTIDDENYLSLVVYAGDSKSQGQYLYKDIDKAIEWPKKVCEYILNVKPYIKFSHFNSSIFSYLPDIVTEYPVTHTKIFFDDFAGRYKKDKWKDFEQRFSQIAPSWKSQCEHERKLISSNRTYFDLSPGMILSVYIPYKEAQKMDETVGSLCDSLHKTVLSLKTIIEN